MAVESLPTAVPKCGLEKRILIIRHQRVMLDRDLARHYGVSTRFYVPIDTRGEGGGGHNL